MNDTTIYTLVLHLRRIATRRLPPHAADDVVQDALLVLLERDEPLPANVSPARYAVGVLKNLGNQYHRRAARTEPLDPGTVPARAAHGSEELARAWVRQLTATAGMSARHLAVLHLYYEEELTARAIGTRLGIPEGTVRGRLARAWTLLRGAQLRLQRQRCPAWWSACTRAEFLGDTENLHLHELYPPGRERGWPARQKRCCPVTNVNAQGRGPTTSPTSSD